MAAATRTGSQVGIPLAPAAWQAVLGMAPTAGILNSVHAYLTENSLKHLRTCEDSETFAALFGDDLPSSSAVFELGVSCQVLLSAQGGNALGGVVSLQRAPRFAAWVEQLHTAAVYVLTASMRSGFASVLPLGVFSWLRQSDAAVLVAGVADIDVDLLQRNTQYSGGATASSIHIQQFWRVLREDFSPSQRQKFIKFVWGQSRLPVNDAAFASNGTRFLIKSVATPVGDGSIDNRLPTADTCFFNLALPPYSCYESVLRQLTTVVSVDAGLDADAV
jgi:hypothetical protein